ncbi:MAG: 23S rRNA (pseudouridine(1915)-N(3))-methyltransferase RlmH [Roseinatronobacter sp.]
MRLHLLAVGRCRSGPERILTEDYLTRFERTGRALALGPCDLVEIDERKAASVADQGAALARAVPPAAELVVLDERGAQMSSRSFAGFLAERRDAGTPALAFAIGGADGLDKSLRDAARWQLSLGQMVWPHMLVRVLLAEQLYRAATILAGSPYHRD